MSKRGYRGNPHKQQQQNLGHRHRAPVEPRVTMLHNPKYREMERELREEYDDLHKRRRLCSGAERHLIDQQIEQKAKRFNVEALRGQGALLELHGMTPEIALAAVKERIEKGKNIGTFEFITGKGNRSPGNEARIKKAVWEEYRGRPCCSIKENERNTGRIIISLW